MKLDRRWIIRRLPRELFEENVGPRRLFRGIKRSYDVNQRGAVKRIIHRRKRERFGAAGSPKASPTLHYFCFMPADVRRSQFSRGTNFNPLI